MPIRIVRKITFLVSMILVSLLIAGGILFFSLSKQGGVFDNGFKTKMQLAEMTLNRDEVLEGLPSVTVNLVPSQSTPSEEKPSSMLLEAGRLISKASKEGTSNDVMNINFSTDENSDIPVQMRLVFNASTSVDYNDRVYTNTVNLLTGMVESNRYSYVSVESTPTPDGGRSLNVETEIKPDQDRNDISYEMENGWSEMSNRLNLFVGDSGNMSRMQLKATNVSVAASFYDDETYQDARSIDGEVFDMLDVVSNMSSADSVLRGQFNLSPVRADDSNMTVTLDNSVNDESFERASQSVLDTLEREGFTSSYWTVLVTVDERPDLSAARFGSF